MSLEAPLVSNETCAFLSQRHNLHAYLKHRDPTLSKRLQFYLTTVRENGQGLWSTEPPKVIADLMESVIGAVHVDGGFEAGQSAAMHVLLPVLKLFQHQKEDLDVISKNPKQVMLQLGGDLVALKCYPEDSTALVNLNVSISDSPFLKSDIISKVATLKCVGNVIAASKDITTVAAENRACSLVISILKQDSKLMDRFIRARSMLSKTITSASKDVSNIDDGNSGDENT